MMQCAVCCRSSSGGSKSIFYCPGCARHSLYELRVESARTLLAREAASRKVEDVVLDQKSASLESGGTRTTRYEPQLASIDRDQLEVRTREIKGQAEVLRREIESARVELSTFRSALARRRADYASATYHLDARRNSSLGSMESFIRRTVARADQQSIQTAESRVFLCREAAKLYGLRQRRRKKGDTFQEDYMIGGVGIVNLKDLNNAPPKLITTSFAHVCHLLVLISHYLSLQLPAEITLPHRDYPLPTIFPPSSSYITRGLPHPNSSTSSPSSIYSFPSPFEPSPRPTDTARPPPRPRPLSLDRPLPQLAKDDAVAHSLFVEGVTLLAWDVAWICRTQGLNIGDTSWEEICSIGKNLWFLLVSTSPLPPQLQVHHQQQQQQQQVRNHSTQPRKDHTTTTTTTISTMMGRYSHGSAHSFLGSAEGSEFMRGWKLHGPMKTVDHVKSYLLSDMAGAEWEVLEGDDLPVGDDGVEPVGPTGAGAGAGASTGAIVSAGSGNGIRKSIGTTPARQQQQQSTISIGDHHSDNEPPSSPSSYPMTKAMASNNTTTTPDTRRGGGVGGVGVMNGTSGWMKLRSRS